MLTKNLPVKAIVQFSIVPVILFIVWSTVVVCEFKFLHFEWLAIPFLPVSVLGIAVSFYVGFKNNASNERQNEARKNWGAITNDSRAQVGEHDVDAILVNGPPGRPRRRVGQEAREQVPSGPRRSTGPRR